MCDPVSAVLAVVSVAYTAYSQNAAASAQAKQVNQQAALNQQVAEYNAKLSDRNAEINDQAARDSIIRGANDAGTIRDNARKANARGRAVMGSSGLLADTGSNLDLLLDNTQAGEINALTVFNNAEREAYGHKVAAYNDRTQAQNTRYQGQMGVASAGLQAQNIRQQGMLAATGTLVTGGADFAQRYGSKSFSTKERWSDGTAFRTR